MALPEGNVAAAQAQRPIVAALHQRRSLGLFNAEVGVKGAAVPAHVGLGQVGELLPIGIQRSHFIIAQLALAQFLNLLREPGDVSLAEGLAQHILGEMEVQCIAAGRYLFNLETGGNAGAAPEALL